MSRQLYCRNCGKKIENENALFCVGCGKRLDPPDEPTTDDKADVLKEQKADEDTVVPKEEKTEDKPVVTEEEKTAEITATQEKAVETETVDKPAGDEKRPVSVLKVAAIVFAVLLLVSGIVCAALGLFKKNVNEPVVVTENDPDDDEADVTPEVTEPVTVVETPTPEAAAVTEEVKPEITPTPIVVYSDIPGSDVKDPEGIHTYKIVIDDVTWKEALFEASMFEGGYLLHINTKEEFDYVTDFIEKSGYGKSIFWIGARREEDPAIYKWADQTGNLVGNSINDLDYWLDKEPTFYDKETGTFEQYVDMFYSKSEKKWVLNDVQNDVLELIPGYTGKMGYIVEIEE